jgi:hypothetical protein
MLIKVHPPFISHFPFPFSHLPSPLKHPQELLKQNFELRTGERTSMLGSFWKSIADMAKQTFSRVAFRVMSEPGGLSKTQPEAELDPNSGHGHGPEAASNRVQQTYLAIPIKEPSPLRSNARTHHRSPPDRIILSFPRTSPHSNDSSA